MAEIDIGMGKSGRRAYGFDDITIVPSRRTRDPEDIDLTWEIDAYRFDLPFMASAMDSVVSPATAIEIGRLGGVGVLNLEGLWTRYEDADAVLAEMAELDEPTAMERMQELYTAPIDGRHRGRIEHVTHGAEKLLSLLVTPRWFYDLTLEFAILSMILCRKNCILG